MKKLVTVITVAVGLLMASLLFSTASYGSTDTFPGAAKADKLEAAKVAEQKGDLARAHSSFLVAAGYYQTAVRISRKNAVLYNKLGIAQLQLHERGAARKNFQQALKLDPQYISAINNLGATSLLDKKYKAAVGYFKQALAMDETVASTHLNLAEAWMGLAETDRAMTEYARALELDADVMSDSAEGVAAQVSSPEQRARISYLIAKMYIKRGNIDGALDYLGRARDLHLPNLAKVYTDPDFTALWQDPRLAKIVKR